MPEWAYSLDLNFTGTVEAATREDAALAAIDDARESLDAHPERWAIADLEVCEAVTQ